MTTAFKGKAQARAQRESESAVARAREKERAREVQRARAGVGAEKARRATSAKGVTLVAATPVKPKERGGRSQTQMAAIGVAPLPKCELVAESGEDGEYWTLSSSPDALLLDSTSASQSRQSRKDIDTGTTSVEDDEEEEEGVPVLDWMEKNTHLALLDTPTKPKKARR